jgi:hypothetical protein
MRGCALYPNIELYDETRLGDTKAGNVWEARGLGQSRRDPATNE